MNVITTQPVVIDNGSGSIKAGFAGEEKPRVIFPNYRGKPKYHRAMVDAIQKESFIGSDAQKIRALLALEYPMEHGIVTDWAAMQQIWEFTYSSDALNCKASDHPVLLTEAPLSPYSHREKMMEIFFETFNVPAIHIQMQAVLSLYAAGRSTGVVLDSGDGVTHCVPVYEGFAIEPAIQRSDIAGRDVTRYLQTLLRKEGHIFHRSCEFEIVREIKEKVCQVALVNQKENEKESLLYTLPDSSTIKIGRAKYLAPEVLFKPELIGTEYQSAHRCIVDAIGASDCEIRKELYSNIFLSGGSTCFNGYGERILAEVRRLLPSDVKLRISAPHDRLNSTWTGGSILAALDSFSTIMKSKKDYEKPDPRLKYALS